MTSNSSWQGAVPGLADWRLSAILPIVPLSLGVAIVIGFMLHVLAVPRVDSREPPLLKSRIPVIGHIIGLIRYQAEYHIMLR